MKRNCGKLIFFSSGIAPLIFSGISKQTDFFKQYQISSYKANTLTKIIKYLNFFCSFVKLIAGLFMAISYIAFEIIFILANRKLNFYF